MSVVVAYYILIFYKNVKTFFIFFGTIFVWVEIR